MDRIPVKASSGSTRISRLCGDDMLRRASARATFSLTLPNCGANCKQAIRMLRCKCVKILYPSPYIEASRA